MMKILTFLSLLVIPLALVGYDGEDERQAFFSGVDYSITTKFDRSFFGKEENPEITWQLEVNGSELEKGKISPSDQRIRFKVNDLRPGIIVSGNIRFSVRRRQRPMILSFFSRDPFSEMRLLKRIKIGLYPADSALNVLLDRYKLSYEKVESLDQFRGQILFISGIDFAAHPQIFNRLLRNMPRGMKIIVLPPVKGSLKFPVGMFTKTMLLPKNGILELRREFDILPLAYNINMEFNGNSIVLKFGDKGNGSGCVSFDVGQGGKLIFSGWSLEDLANPTGIYLLRYYIQSDIK